MEYYAKISYLNKGTFRVSSAIWVHDPSTRIDRLVRTRKFFLYNSARRWSERKVFSAMMQENGSMFIRHIDISRREYNG